MTKKLSIVGRIKAWLFRANQNHTTALLQKIKNAGGVMLSFPLFKRQFYFSSSIYIPVTQDTKPDYSLEKEGQGMARVIATTTAIWTHSPSHPSFCGKNRAEEAMAHFFLLQDLPGQKPAIFSKATLTQELQRTVKIPSSGRDTQRQKELCTEDSFGLIPEAWLDSN